MRNSLYLIIFFLIAISCDNDDNTVRNSKADDAEEIITKGKWKITYFFDTDKEDTDNFAEYTFQFPPNGALIATSGLSTLSGSWSITDKDTSDDNNNNEDIDLNISFATSPDFSELTEDWEIISITSTKIELRHVSGGNGGTDLLTFEKV